MTLDYLSILVVIAFLSIVQSFFGMGVLVFGTPTLLLMGYDFISTLGYLLPASFTISLLQVLNAGPNRMSGSRDLYWFCLPGIGAGLWLTGTGPLASWTTTLIGGTLLLSALVRIWPPSRHILTTLLERHCTAYHLIMGLTHGLTNLGGALLAILASGKSTDKEVIRNTIAHYYLAFSAVQMLFLAAIMGHYDILISNLLVVPISATIYLFIGKRIYSKTSSPVYNSAMTAFIAIYGLVVLMNF